MHHVEEIIVVSFFGQSMPQSLQISVIYRSYFEVLRFVIVLLN